MANRFYFAYGSNMNPDRIRQRIPQARPVGTAFILGWRIKERLYADIERSKGGRVDGVLYLLTPSEIYTLDAYTHTRATRAPTDASSSTRSSTPSTRSPRSPT